MAWRVWGKTYAHNELVQRLKLPIDTCLLGCRIWVIVYNNPIFTSIKMEIVEGIGAIAESTNVFTKAQISTLPNAVKEIYFDFNKINLKKDNEYGFRIFLSGFVAIPDAELSWKIDFPRPVYDPNFVPDIIKISSAPFTLTLIGSEE